VRLRPRAPARESLLEHAAELVAHFERNAGAVRAAYGELESRRIERVLRNMLEYRAMLLERDRGVPGSSAARAAFLGSYNRRERVNADNLLWLIDHYYRGEKLIIWLHNVHAAHTRIGPQYEKLVTTDTVPHLESMGRVVKLRLGDALYSVGTIAFEGEWGFPDHERVVLQRPAPESLEALMYQQAQSVAIVNLPEGRAPWHWLRQAIPGSLTAQLPDRRYPIVWPDVFDAVLFVRRMTPAETAW
jgi:erythromycin esterase-like protein